MDTVSVQSSKKRLKSSFTYGLASKFTALLGNQAWSLIMLLLYYK